MCDQNTDFDAPCEHCGRRPTFAIDPMNRGIMTSFMKLMAAYRAEPRPYKTNELGLTHSQHCNFTKLKYHRLVSDVAGGFVVPTMLGIDFAAGTEIPKYTINIDKIIVDYGSDLFNEVMARSARKNKDQFITIESEFQEWYKKYPEYAAEKSPQQKFDFAILDSNDE